MQRIELSPSRKGRAFALLLYAALAALIAAADFVPWVLWPAEVLLTLILGDAYRRSAGLGRAAVITRGADGQWHFAAPGIAEQPLLAIEPRLVAPWLLSARLQGERKRLWILAFSDGLDADAHRQLRRLVLRGIAPQIA